MKTSKYLLALGVCAGSLFAATGAGAQVFIGFNQVGTDVVATATGTFNTSLATLSGSSTGLGKYVFPSAAFFGLGSGTNVNFYAITGAPTTFSNATSQTFYTSSSGTTLGMNGSVGYFFLDPAYVSGSAIATTALFANTTLSAMGLNPATYRIAAGGNAITLSIGQAVAAVPEPATWGMLVLGFGMVGAAARRRQKVSVRFRHAA